MLQRNYFFEFAGMPQSGKSTVVDIVAHFLKRSGYPLGEYRGGSRYSSLYNAPIADLNLGLACKAAEFVVSEVRHTPAKIFLLDRGLIDRCIFTDTLLRSGKIEPDVARSITDFLSLPQFLEILDGVFIFVTSPDIALQRENANKLVQTEGEVMNRDFLSTMRSATIHRYNNVPTLIPNVLLFDTEQHDGKVQETARKVVDNILSTIGKKSSRTDRSYFKESSFMFTNDR